VKASHLVMFVAWSLTVLLVTGFFVLAFTLGDCMDEVACAASKRSALFITFAVAFVIYWSVAFALFKRWSR